MRFIPHLSVCLMLVLASTAAAQVDRPIVETPPKPFHLLFIYGETTSEPSRRAYWMLSRPTSTQMQRWRSVSEFKPLEATTPLVRENHADILRDAKSLPAIALVDASNGGRIALVDGSNLPSNDQALAEFFDATWQETVKAAAAAGRQPLADPPSTGGVPYRSVDEMSIPMAPTFGGPFRDRDGGGLFNPSVEAAVTARAGLERSTLFGLIGLGTLGFLGVLTICLTIGGVGWMVCEVISNDPDPS